jgi:hypothetical protein
MHVMCVLQPPCFYRRLFLFDSLNLSYSSLCSQPNYVASPTQEPPLHPCSYATHPMPPPLRITVWNATQDEMGRASQSMNGVPRGLIGYTLPPPMKLATVMQCPVEKQNKYYPPVELTLASRVATISHL